MLIQKWKRPLTVETRSKRDEGHPGPIDVTNCEKLWQVGRVRLWTVMEATGAPKHCLESCRLRNQTEKTDAPFQHIIVSEGTFVNQVGCCREVRAFLNFVCTLPHSSGTFCCYLASMQSLIQPRPVQPDAKRQLNPQSELSSNVIRCHSFKYGRERERGWRQPQKSNRTNAKCWYRAEITIDEKQHGYITCASACTLLISFDLFSNYPHHGPHLATFLGDAFESFCIASLNKVSRKGKGMALSFCHNGFRLFGQTGLYSGSA